MKDSAGVSNGFGFIGFNLHEDAKKAMESLNGAIIGSNNLYVGKAQRKAKRKDQLVYANKELLNYHTQILKASILFVKSLNISTDNIKLEHIFGAYGKVTSARVMHHYNGFIKGFGFVNFSTVEEAKMALDSLNETIVEGTCLHVTAAQYREECRKNCTQNQGTKARSYQGSYTTYMPMRQSQEVTTTKKVSSNQQYVCSISVVSFGCSSY
ncbi:polyadenylate-binding protein 6-like [Apium graveolens]|uniref:polyadenylate-binding protein 6-like n=1 Tax=Apium graveolens TaxID=4045 RepID=UPI003D7BD314